MAEKSKKLNWLESSDDEGEPPASQTSIEQKLGEIFTPFHNFIQNQTTASFLLLLAAAVALVFSGFPSLLPYYQEVISTTLGLHLHTWALTGTLKFWVNDVLLVFFFFFVGLEIKRELLVGEFADYRRAFFVISAALGGMLMPALIFYGINYGTDTQVGWGIPMATDTAFVLGILSCFRHKLPPSIFMLIAALAVIDDIGAIIVVAVVYSQSFHPIYLGYAALILTVAGLMNFCGVRRALPYCLIGIVLWSFIEAAGIHGTAAGILVAFLIPARAATGPNQFISGIKKLLKIFEKRHAEKDKFVLEDSQQHDTIAQVKILAEQATTPLQCWEAKLELPVALLVLPFFALVNAGVKINFDMLQELLTQPLALGIILGLVVGKPLGIALFGGLALLSRHAVLPDAVDLRLFICVACFTGIGFTMSLFMANLAFSADEALQSLAKVAILLSSLLAMTAGSLGLLLRPSRA